MSDGHTTKEAIASIVKHAEGEFVLCWNWLRPRPRSKTKKVGPSRGDELFQIQPRLAGVLFKLSAAYRILHQERQMLVARKNEFDAEWFGNRLRLLATHQSVIEMTIAIGRGLGDAFAWIFYRQDAAMLQEHRKKEPVFHSSPGIGGTAELEFAKNVHEVGGHFVLHHCTTNMLRLGDISLIDRKSLRVVGLGEIKAGNPELGRLPAILSIALPKRHLAKVPPPDPNNLPRRSRDSTDILNNEGRRRLKRQMSEMAASVEMLANVPDRKESVHHDSLLSELDELIKGLQPGGSAVCRAGEGLVLVAFRRPSNWSLYRWLANGRQTAGAVVPPALVKAVLDAKRPDRYDNSLYYGSLYYDEDGRSSLLPGMTHLLWWPLQPESIRSIVFHDVRVFTAFNPVHLWARLEEAGYTVIDNGPGKQTIYKTVDKTRIEIEGVAHFMHMISHYFFPESSVIEMIQRVDSEANARGSGVSTRIAIFPHQLFESVGAK